MYDLKLTEPGDWLSEMTMTVHGSGKVKQKSTKSNNGTMSLEERKKSAMYADTFIQCFEPAFTASFVLFLTRFGTAGSKH